MRLIACALLVVATTHATKVCTIGESRKDGPNICFCLGDRLGWSCAPADSPLSMLRVQALQERLVADSSDDSCEPEKNYRSLCNTCRCSSDGKKSNSICTMMTCSDKVWDDNGYFISSEEDTEDILMRKKRDVNDNKTTCKPGESFKYYCNTCRCNDGNVKTASCTKMYCDRNEWNIDGTLKYSEEIETYQQHPSYDDEITEGESNGRLFNSYFTGLSSVRPRGTEGLCHTGEIFKKWCNYCICGTDRSIVGAPCTNMDCSLTVKNMADGDKYGADKYDVMTERKKRFVEIPTDQTTLSKPRPEQSS